MKRWLILLFLFAGIAPVTTAIAATPDRWSPLLEVEALAAMLEDDIRVIHVTGDFTAGHIPGAAHTPYPAFRGPADNPGKLPPLDELTALLQAAGIDADTPVVVVHQGSAPPDMGAATRVYWTLKSLGVEETAVLNGGFAAWQQAGLPVSTVPSDITPTRFEPQWDESWQIHSAEIMQHLDAPSLQVVDSRPAAFFEGRQATASRAGTIPGAINMSFQQFFDGNQMRPQSELQSLVADSNLTDAPIATFCNTGQLGSIGWFVLSEMAGIDNVRLYAESITDWADKGLPMENSSD